MGGYKFEGKRGNTSPRCSDYTFYIAAKDTSDNYSESNQVTVQHPGIQQLDLQSQDVQGLLSSIKIKLPKVYSETSQYVFPEDTTSEEKDILSYRLHIQEVDSSGNTIGDEEIIDINTEDINNRTYYYQAETGKIFDIQIGAYDSVYHPDYNLSLYEQTKSQVITQSTFKVRPPDVDSSLIESNDLTTSIQTYEEDLEKELTLKAGYKDPDTGEEYVGGIGLAYNEDVKDIDVQVLADRFRLFDPDVEPNGTSVFAVDSTDDIIYMDASQITLRASDTNNTNFFDLDTEGLSISTSGLQLDKSGNAIFNGEVNSSQFSLTGGNLVINQDGINANISSEFTLNSSDGSAEFGGQLNAASGKLGDSTNYVEFDGTNLNLNTEGNIEIYGKKNLTIKATDTEGFIKLEDADGNYTILDEEHLKFYQSGQTNPHWYSKRVVYGVAQSGTEIDLTQNGVPWEQPPKVQTAISSLQTYYPSESDTDIYHECYSSNETVNGFKVHGRSFAPVGNPETINHSDLNSSMSYNQFSDGDESVVSQLTQSNTAKIDIDLEVRGTITESTQSTTYYGHEYNIRVMLRKEGGSWFEIGSAYSNDFKTESIYKYFYFSEGGLDFSKYEIKFIIEGVGGIDNNRVTTSGLEAEITSYYNDYIESGEVLYIAIEGGQYE